MVKNDKIEKANKITTTESAEGKPGAQRQNACYPDG